MKLLFKTLIICKVFLIIQIYIFTHQLSFPDSKYSIKYKLKEGDVLTYGQAYEVKSQIYPDREEKYHLQIEWTAKIGVVAHKDGFYHLAIQYNRKKLNLVNRTSLERSLGKKLVEDLFYTLNNFDQNFAQYVVIDEWGQNINGSFYLNEMPTIFHAPMSRIFHLPEYLLKIKESYFREDEQKLSVTFSRIENTEMGECFVFEGELPGGKARLLMNKNLGIPDLMMFSAQYLLFERLKSERFLMLFVERKNSKWEEMLRDQELNKAVLLSSLGQKTLFCNREIIENFLKSDDKMKQNLAIAYCSLKGIPEGLDLTGYLHLNNPTVRFNAAKALFKFRNNRTPLEALTSDENSQVRLRAENFLARSSYLLPERNLELFKTVQDFIYSEDCNYEKIRADISEAREVLKFMKPENNLVGGCYRHFIRDKETGILRPYYVYLPEDYDPAELYPMITYLGGGDGRGDIGFKTIYQELKISNDLSNYILFVPQAQGIWWHEEVEKVFNQLLPRILRSYSIDTNRVYIAGSSNGGMGTFFYSTHQPDRFAAIATIMGHPVVKHRFPETGQDREVLENLRNTAIYMVHGEKDDVVSPGGDRLAYKKLSKLNYRIEYEELSGRAHDIGFRESKNKIIQLFTINQRNSHPEKVELVMNFPQYNRSYWIRVDKTRRLPAKVSAKIKDNNVDIKTKGVQHLTIFLDEGLVDLTKETIIKINRKEVYRAYPSPSMECILSSAREKNDSQLSYSIALPFEVD